jgi:hypothetical protein
MAIRYDICQSPGCIVSPVARAWAQVMLKTLGDVPRSEDPTAGALYKAVKADARHGTPVFVLDENPPAESPADGYSKAAIDVSWKANHYRVHFRTKGGPWRAFRIVTLPAMYHFNRASRAKVAQIARTRLLTDNLAHQFQRADGDEMDNYNTPANGGDGLDSYSTPGERGDSYSTPVNRGGG